MTCIKRNRFLEVGVTLIFYRKDIYTVAKLKIRKIRTKSCKKTIYKTYKIQIPTLPDFFCKKKKINCGKGRYIKETLNHSE